MNILVIGNSYGDAVGNFAEEQQIADDFKTLGHNVFFIERGTWKKDVEKINEKIDLIFIANTYCVDWTDMDLLRDKFNAKVIYWTPDFTEPQYIKDCIEKYKHADLFVSKELVYQHLFDEAGVNHHYWPADIACDHYQKSEVVSNHFYNGQYYPERVPVGITCNWVHNPERMIFLWELQQKFPDLVITSSICNELATGKIANGYGLDDKNGYYKLKNVKTGLFGSLFCQLVAITKINLAVDWIQAPYYWSNRIACYMCAGGFVLAKYVRGMEAKFHDYIVYFHDLDDCLEKIHYYLEHEEERQQIAERGYQWANVNLRSIVRTKQLMKVVENELVG